VGKNDVEAYIYWVLGEIIILHHKKFQDLNINKSYFCDWKKSNNNITIFYIWSRLTGAWWFKKKSLIAAIFSINSTFEHPAFLNNGKKLCGSIYLLSFGKDYSFAP
jgi:hypothetical protein